MTTLLEIDCVASGYGRTTVLRGVSLNVAAGEIVALIGPNGAGKSTLLNTIMGLLPVTAGDVRFDGRSIVGLPTPAIVRAGLGEVPERRQLFGDMSVEENLRMGAYTVAERGAIAAALEEQFARFPILRERRRQATNTLSGGEQQMVAIARAMMAGPRLLLLDEPSLGLAPMFAERIMDQIVALREAGKTILLVEQNARAALGIAGRGYVLENGHIAMAAAASELLASRAVQDAYLGGQSHATLEERIRSKRQAILGR